MLSLSHTTVHSRQRWQTQWMWIQASLQHQVPQCALPAYGLIASQGCGPNLACICGHENFFVMLQGVLLKGTCNLMEAEASLASTRSICTKAVPWLNRNRGTEIVAAATVLSITATISFVMRVMARRVSSLRFGWDDWLIFVALVFGWGVTICQYIAVPLGLGRHILLLDIDQVVAFSKVFFATTVIFPVSAFCIKISVLFFYHRIFPMQRFRILSYLIGAICVAWFIAFIFLQFFLCIPLAFYWDKSIPGGRCININNVSSYGTSPPDILTNIAILVLPIPELWNLQMQRSKKVAITGIFLLGCFAVVGSIVRVPFITQLKVTDVSYTIVNSAIWLNVECNIGILSACLPVLRPLFSKTFPSSVRSKFSRSTSRYGTGSQRLPDIEKNIRNRQSTLGGSTNVSGASGPGMYSSGGPKSQRTWYNAAASAIGSKNEETGSDCSQEDMVPMGRIAVRHELGWEASDQDSHVGRTAT